MALASLFGRNRHSLGLIGAAYRAFPPNLRMTPRDLLDRSVDLEALYRATVRHCGRPLHPADERHAGRRERMARRACLMGLDLGFSSHQLKHLLLGVYLHDIGMTLVPAVLWNRTEGLTREEALVLQMHPVWGVEMLADVDFPWDVKPLIRWHHERQDGSGYPDGRAGDAIPLAAQVIGMLDTYYTFLAQRPVRAVEHAAAAIADVREHAGWWRPEVFRAFLSAMGQSAWTPADSASPAVTVGT